MNVDSTRIIELAKGCKLDVPQWALLHDLWNRGTQAEHRCLTIGKPFSDTAVDVIERIGDTTTFWYQRNMYGPGRATTIDRYGIVGLSMVNPADRRYIVTEGVSDFLTLKLCYPQLNVVGFTTIGGNRNATKILLSLADRIVYVADNDIGKAQNTGLTNALKIKQNYERYGKRVYIQMPEAPHKDITQQVLYELKFHAQEV